MKTGPSWLAVIVLYICLCEMIVSITSAHPSRAREGAHLNGRDSPAGSHLAVTPHRDLVARGCLSDCFAHMKNLVMGPSHGGRYSEIPGSPTSSGSSSDSSSDGSKGKGKGKRPRRTPPLPPSLQKMGGSRSGSTSTSTARKSIAGSLFQKAQEDRQAFTEGTSARDKKGTIQLLKSFGSSGRGRKHH